MKKTIYSFLAIGVLVGAISILPANPIEPSETEPPQIRPVCDLNRGSGTVPIAESQTAPVGQESPEAEPLKPLVSASNQLLEDMEIPTITSTEKETPKVEQAPTVPTASKTAEPKMGDTRTIDGQKQVYFLGFGWIEDSDEPSVGIVVDGDGDINKMVGSMGGSTYAEDMYENGNKIGNMGSEDDGNCEPPLEASCTPQSGDVMIDFQTGETTVYGE